MNLFEPRAASAPPPPRQRVPLQGSYAGTLLLAVGWAAAGAWGRGLPYCNLTSVEITPATNAVVLRFTTDGILSVEGNWRDYLGPPPDYEARRRTRISFTLLNAKLRTRSFVNVSIYPVSHVELAPLPDSKEGIGIRATIVLYKPGRVATIGFTRMNFSLVEDHARRGITYDLSLDKSRKNLLAIITSDRLLPPEPQRNRDERLRTSRGRLQVSGTADHVALYTVNVALRQVLDALAKQTGAQFVLAAGVQRIVSVSLFDMSVDQVVRALARGYGLSLDRRGAVYYLAEASASQRAAYDKAQQELIPLQYVKAADALNLLPPVVLPFAHADAEHNALAVSGPRYLLDKIRHDAAVLDTRPELVEVELRAEEMRRSDLKALGLTGTYQTGGSKWMLDTDAGELSFRSADLVSDDWEAQLRALERTERAHTRARMRKVVVSSHYAELFVGQTRLLRVLQQQGRRQEPQLLSIDVGIRLQVVPFTSGAGPVWMWISASLSSVLSQDPVTRLPTISVRRMTTCARVADGDTAVLVAARLGQEDRRRRPPDGYALGSVLGWAFQTFHAGAERTDLVLFLTPRIVTHRPGVAPPKNPNSPAFLAPPESVPRLLAD